MIRKLPSAKRLEVRLGFHVRTQAMMANKCLVTGYSENKQVRLYLL